MDALKKSLVLGASSMLALTSAGCGLVEGVVGADAQQDVPAATDAQANTASSTQATLNAVEGTLTYTQTAVDSNEIIKKNLGDAAQYLCGTRPAGEADSAVAAEDWTIEVKGAVGNSYIASYEELAHSAEIQSVLLGCACAGNPSDGRASANAEVSGLPVLTLIKMANPDADANTVVFASADGYEVALPLTYIQMRYCPLVFDVNGAPIAESMGGTNQLWLGSTAASYFARDVVSITLEKRETPPPSPSSDEARASYANLPNVGILLGGDVS